MYQKKIPINEQCGIDLFREVMNGKWKIHLLYYISTGVNRPGALQKHIPEATRRVLNMQLNQMEEHGLVYKKVYNQLPPKVEYFLTGLGQSLVPVVEAIGNWGDAHSSQLQQMLQAAKGTA